MRYPVSALASDGIRSRRPNRDGSLFDTPSFDHRAEYGRMDQGCKPESDLLYSNVPLQILALIAAMVFSWSANFGDFVGSDLAPEGNFPYAFSLPVLLLDRFDAVTGAQTAAASAALFI
jgi:hypothetical protein